MSRPKITSRKNQPPTNLHLDKRAAELAANAPLISDEQANTDDDLLRTSDLALWLGVTKAWLEHGRKRDYGPPFIKLAPQAVRYRRADVFAWLKHRQNLSGLRNSSTKKGGGRCPTTQT